MKTPRTVGIDTLRQRLKERVGAARTQDQHTIVTSYGKPVAVLVPFAWWAMVLGQLDYDDTEETA